MISMLKRVLPVALLIMATTGLSAQQFVVKGSITTFDTIPVLKAQVKVKSTGVVSESDMFGLFGAAVAESDKITISAEGFVTKSIRIRGGEEFLEVELKLKPGERSADQAINDGKHIRVSDQARFRALSEAGVDYSTYSNLVDILRTMSGVNIVGDDIRIRGNTSINPSNNEALFVVDGVIVSKMVFKSTPTSDIKRIKVLKGSEAAIYGSQGGNGVIEVYTKRGLEQ